MTDPPMGIDGLMAMWSQPWDAALGHRWRGGLLCVQGTVVSLSAFPSR